MLKQKLLLKHLQAIFHLQGYTDDVLECGATAEEHLKRLEEVLSRTGRSPLSVGKGWTVSAEVKVPFHGQFHHIPRPQGGQGRSSSTTR